MENDNVIGLPVMNNLVSDELRNMIFEFDVHEKRQELLQIVDRVKDLEDALIGMRDYYSQHKITAKLYRQVELALGYDVNHVQISKYN